MSPEPPRPEPVGRRLFLREPGWQVAMKVGSDRTFCYAITPGDDAYHRLSDGEIFLHRGDEKVCIPCAERLGLLGYGPKTLREPIAPIAIEPELPGDADGFDVGPGL